MITRRLYGKLRLLLLLFVIDLVALIVIADLATGIAGLQGDGLFMVLFMLLLVAGLWLMMVLLLASGLRYLSRVVARVRPRSSSRKYKTPNRLSTR